MIRIENVEVYGWEAAIRGMRNPLNSWERCDSCFCEDEPSCEGSCKVRLGQNDLNLMKRLINAGADHSKFMRMITVAMDVTAPLYWWKEFDTYKVGTVANSCSTMHKLHSCSLTLDDFSCEHLTQESKKLLLDLIGWINHCRYMYVTKKNKEDWWQLIQLLPSSYNQKRTVMLNYAVLQRIYHARKNHKLDEWHTLCEWIESLPYASDLITGKESVEELDT